MRNATKFMTALACLLFCVTGATVFSFKSNVSAFQGVATVNYNAATTYQTIEGFGAFGGRNSNWSDPATWWTDSWGALVLNDLGLTITRNEWYPPQIDGETQDTDWETQKAFIQKYHHYAAVSGTPLKQVISIWSPPAYMKENNSAKNGGRLRPEYYAEFANWLVECVNAYRAVGVSVYGISLQNEPSAVVEYNSCYYSPQDYVNMVKVVGPIFKAAHPTVKIMGPEEMTCETWNWDASYGKALLADAEALRWIDIIVVHPYTIEYQFGPSDPVVEARQMQQVYAKYKAAGKPIWTTECCLWNTNWLGGMLLAESIYNCMYYGNANAWLHWLTSGDSSTDYTLLQTLTINETKGDKYYAFRHFAKYVRPGAKRVDTSSTNPDLLAIGFKHDTQKTFTMVLINKSNSPLKVNLTGNLNINLKAEVSSLDEKAVSKESISALCSAFTLPARTIATYYGDLK